MREIRISRGKTQEELADVLGTTRQRYSRMEKGQVDISYAFIRKISAHYGIATTEITDVLEENKGLVVLFREEDKYDDVIGCVGKIEEILRVFSAHEKLYHRMKGREHYEH